MSNKDLKSFLSPWISKVPKIILKNIVLNSNDVTPGDLFFAIPGHKTDGKLYIKDAIQKGAAAILVYSKNKESKIIYYNNIPIIYFTKLEEKLSALANRFYDYPSRKLCLIGITGTNGKTTVAHLIAQWLSLLGEKNAIMGTIGNGTIEKMYPSENTTDSPIKIQKFISSAVKKECNFLTMEVSSQGLTQYRVEDLYFSFVIFTNISHDHLDYHKNLNEYISAKWKLFSKINSVQKIINIDDPIGRIWIKSLPKAIAVSSKGLKPNSINRRWISAKYIKYFNFGTKIYFTSTWGKGILRSNLIGKFNVSNLLLSLAVLLANEYSLSKLLDTSIYLKRIKGRMEIFKSKGKPIVILDYAHNPDALKKALVTAKLYCYGNLWCIFGCGGNRDKEKRSIMGEVAEKYADKIIITSDNPRNEVIQNIVNDIIKNCLEKNKIKIIYNRKEAIFFAIDNAKSKDVILVAGKGHENIQIVGNDFFNHSDRSIIKKIFI